MKEMKEELEKLTKFYTDFGVISVDTEEMNTKILQLFKQYIADKEPKDKKLDETTPPYTAVGNYNFNQALKKYRKALEEGLG